MRRGGEGGNLGDEIQIFTPIWVGLLPRAPAFIERFGVSLEFKIPTERKNHVSTDFSFMGIAG